MRAFLILIVTVLMPAFAGAAAGKPASQAPAGQPAPAPQPPVEQPAPTAKPNPLEPKGYTYEPEGRRDPFVSLVRRGTESPGSVPAGARPSGLAGATTSEVVLTGTYRGASGAWTAILRGVDRKSHIARAGDKLFDGTVSAVTENSVVILQQVNDPLSLATQREVRKTLRQTEEAK